MKKNEKDETLMHEWKNQTACENNSFDALVHYFESGLGSVISKLENFPKYVRRQAISKFIARADLFRMVLDIHGSIIDCGVNAGCSLMTFAHLSSIFEPVNYTRKIIGFDTFKGIPYMHKLDGLSKSVSSHVRKGGFSAKGYEKDIMQAAGIFDSNRNLGHIPKIEIIKGDARKTIPQYVKDNPHLVVSILHLDMDVYEPTKIAIQAFLPRMPKGAMIIFDEINQPGYPGETMALVKGIGIKNLRIQRCIYETGLSYAILD